MYSPRGNDDPHAPVSVSSHGPAPGVHQEADQEPGLGARESAGRGSDTVSGVETFLDLSLDLSLVLPTRLVRPLLVLGPTPHSGKEESGVCLIQILGTLQIITEQRMAT